MTVSIDGSNGVVFNDLTTQNTSAFYGGLAFRNRIINGAMVISQRNAGAAINPATDGSYPLDRWQLVSSQTSKFSVQQNAASVTPPVGFANYLGATSLSSYTVISTDSFAIQQKVEGFNIADLGWGTASAATVTLSFWVRSSLTGTFGGALSTGGYARAYPFSYTINAANTWEQKSITIAGDTSGTWPSNNTEGIRVAFSLGAGSARSGTAGAWVASSATNATGATSVVGTSGATFYITGVQLEKGSTATSFDYRPYGTELGLCQRYLPALANNATAAGTNAQFIGQAAGSTTAFFFVNFPVNTRIAPTGVTVVGTSSFSALNATGGAYNAFSSITFNSAGVNSALLLGSGTSGLIAGDATAIGTSSATAQILFTGCEL
tara:strand:+ start:1719 stop:2855 length:1137 start_codon:yes stop_codon:yes gene_type:complete